ncbi:MAG: D-3-phosphoglycerate dehydrogenase [archaeon GW2011_AR4]|nr:MAG: D-3-phosphoglycerate dehydrogenase [archaeon GW2011_AR4]
MIIGGFEMANDIRVLLLDRIDPVAKGLLEEQGYEVATSISQPLEEVIGEFDAVGVRSKTQLTAELLRRAREGRTEYVCRAGSGVDNIDVNAATGDGLERHIIVANTPDANTIAVAELSMGLLLTLSRNLYPAIHSTREGKWEKSRFQGSELQGKNLGVIGLGRIGLEVARRAWAFGMNIIAYDVSRPEENIRSLGYTPATLQSLLQEADYVTVHVPLLPATRGLIGEEQFSLMKPTAYLINTSRGGIIREEALRDALLQKRIGGAALDVFEQEERFEQGDSSNVWWEGLPDDVVFLPTPHIGASTRDAQRLAAETLARQIIAYFSEGLAINAVNKYPVHEESIPYVRLVRSLGRIASQIITSPVSNVQFTYHGNINSADREALNRAGLVGLLEHQVEEASYDSVLEMVERRGITYAHRFDEGSQYRNLVEIMVEVEGQTLGITGKIDDEGRMKVKSIDGRVIEMPIRKKAYLIVLNDNRPGIIHAVTGVLSSHDINISACHNEGEETRTTNGGTALSVYALDSPLSRGVIGQVAALDGIQWVKYADLS